MYVFAFIWLLYELNCCADCSQSEKEGRHRRMRSLGFWKSPACLKEKKGWSLLEAAAPMMR